MKGKFADDPSLTWLTDPNKPDWGMQLLAEFWFDDQNAKRWTAPAKFVTDGASIPRALWSLIGSPFTGDYRRAAIVHDKACEGAKPAARRAADRMFYNACRVGGCSIWDATVLYLGVRIGAALPFVAEWRTAAAKSGPRLAPTTGDLHLVSTFQAAADQILSAGETDDIAEIEARTDRALSLLTGVDFRKR